MTKSEETRLTQVLGWFATFAAVLMYVSYIPQILKNLEGAKANPIQPLVAAISCLLWIVYGLLRKDYPLIAANAPGVLFGAVAFFTALQ